MNWIDKGYLISKSNYNENSIIAEFFTENYGKCSGVIFGATSKKIKSYLQIGNELHINYNYKNVGRTGYFKVEILKANAPLFFDDKKKLMCISSAMNLIKLLTVESQVNKEIFTIIKNFFKDLHSEKWLMYYIFWELNLFKFLGYDLDLKTISSVEFQNNEKKYFVKSNSIVRNVPNFLIDKNDDSVNNDTLILGLKLVTDYLDKSILKPNNINHPHQRVNFLKVLE